MEARVRHCGTDAAKTGTISLTTKITEKKIFRLKDKYVKSNSRYFPHSVLYDPKPILPRNRSTP